MTTKRFALYALLLALGACALPSQHSVARFGRFRVALAGSLDGVHDFSAEHRAAIMPMFEELDAIGPDIVYTESLADADVIVRAAGDLPGGACEVFSVRDPRVVYVNTACMARGALALRKSAAHGVLHAYTWAKWGWVGHVCQWPVNDPVPATCHPTIRCWNNDCLMSTGVTRPDEGPTFTEAYTGSIAEPTPSHTDLELFDHCATAGRCEP